MERHIKIIISGLLVFFLVITFVYAIPTFTINSPEDRTSYDTTTIDLNWTVDGELSWCGFSLDDSSFNSSICQNNISFVSSYSNTSSIDYPVDIEIIGDYLYMVSYSANSFTIFDISDKTNPVQLGSISGTTDMYFPESLDVIGDTAFVSAKNDSVYTGALKIINITNKENPVIISAFQNKSILQSSKGLKFSDNLIYITSLANTSLVVINVSDLGNPTQVGFIQDEVNLSQLTWVEVMGDYAYIGSLVEDYFTIINISDKTNMNVVSSYLNSSFLTYPRNGKVIDDFLYIIGGGSNDVFAIFNISNKSNPIITGFYDDGSFIDSPTGLHVSEKLVYISNSAGDSFLVLDISDKTNPYLKANYTDDIILDGATGIDVSDNYVYVLGRFNDSLNVFNLGTIIDNNITLSNIADGAHTLTLEGMNFTESIVQKIISFNTHIPIVILETPTDKNHSIDFSSGDLLLNCSATDSVGLTNISLYSDYTGSWQLIETKNLSGTSDSATFTLDLSPQSNFFSLGVKWNCLAFDTDGNSFFAWDNSTFSEFDLGTHNNTDINTTYLGFFDKGNETYREFPDNGETKNTSSGLINMTGNVLLLHFNEENDWTTNAALTTDLAALWHLNVNENLGESSSHVLDFSGNGYNGTVVGAVENFTGKIGGGFNFDGDNDYIAFGDILDAELTDDTYAISLWQNMHSYTDVDGYSGFSLSKWHTSGASDNCFIIYPTLFRSYTNSTYYTPTLGQWQHLFINMNNGVADVYLDGVFINSSTGNVCNDVGASYPFRIGNLYNNAYDFNGTLDEIAIWNRSLSAAEIFDIYQRGNLTHDSSGNNYEGNVEISTNTYSVVSSLGKFNGAFRYNKGDTISVGGKSDFAWLHGAEDTSNFKVSTSFWIRFSNPNPDGIYGLLSTGWAGSAIPAYDMYYEDRTTAYGYSRQISLSITHGIGGQNILAGGSPAGSYPNDVNWHHVVTTYDHSLANTNYILYIDGVQIATANKSVNTPSTANSNYSLRLGSLGYGNYPLDGKMDEVAIWNRTLSAAEVANIYNAQNGRYAPMGDYISKVFNPGGVVNFSNFNWEKYLPYKQELLADQEVETGYTTGNISMTGNVLLQHFNYFGEIQSSNNIGDKLVGLWHFNDDDITSATGVYGFQKYGAPADCTAVGKFGTGCYFSGAPGGLVPLPAQNMSIVAGEMTISFWFNTPDKNLGYFFDNRNPGSWYILKNYGPSGLCSNTGGGNICFDSRIEIPGSSYGTNTWYHVVVIDNSTNSSIYLNGELIDVGEGHEVDMTTGFFVGMRFSDQNHINATIDEVAVWNRSLSSGEISILYQNGNSTMRDYSGNGNHEEIDLTDLSKTPISSSSSKFNNSFTFDGVDDRINVGNDASLSTTGNLSISLWFNAQDEYIHGKTLITKHYNAEYDLTMWGDSIAYYNGPNYQNGNAVRFNYIFDRDTWYHVLFTRNGDTKTVKLYVNGVDINDDFVYNDAPPSSSNNVSIGYRVTGGTQPFNGSIDEVAIWNRTLVAEDAMNLYQRGILGLTMQTRVSNDNVTWSIWSDKPNPSGVINSSTNYIQYKAILETDDKDYSPKFNWINFSYNGACSPLLNTDWIIGLYVNCKNKNVNIGTGNLIINLGGELYLSDSTNFTANELIINRTGDSVFMEKFTRLILG